MNKTRPAGGKTGPPARRANPTSAPGITPGKQKGQNRRLSGVCNFRRRNTPTGLSASTAFATTWPPKRTVSIATTVCPPSALEIAREFNAVKGNGTAPPVHLRKLQNSVESAVLSFPGRADSGLNPRRSRLVALCGRPEPFSYPLPGRSDRPGGPAGYLLKWRLNVSVSSAGRGLQC